MDEHKKYSIYDIPITDQFKNTPKLSFWGVNHGVQ